MYSRLKIRNNRDIVCAVDLFCKSLVSIGKDRATEQNLAESGSVRLWAARQLKEFYFLCINLFPTFLPISFHSLKTYLHLLQIRKNTNVFDVCALHFLHSLLKKRKTFYLMCKGQNWTETLTRRFRNCDIISKLWSHITGTWRRVNSRRARKLVRNTV